MMKIYTIIIVFTKTKKHSLTLARAQTVLYL